VRVTVRLFARLRDIAGTAELAREVAPGATIRDLWHELAGEYPELVPYERPVVSDRQTIVLDDVERKQWGDFRRWQADNIKAGAFTWVRSNLLRELPLA